MDWLGNLEKATPIGRWLAPPDKSPLKNLDLIMGLAIGFAACWRKGPFWRKTGNMKLCILEIKKIAESRGIQFKDCDGPTKKRDETWRLDFVTEVL